jgi:hypothetical protein
MQGWARSGLNSTSASQEEALFDISEAARCGVSDNADEPVIEAPEPENRDFIADYPGSTDPNF